MLTHADALLALLEDQPDDTPAQLAAKTALRAKFVEYELPADFVTDLRADIDALRAAFAGQRVDNQEGGENTSAIGTLMGKHINHCEDSLTAAVFTHLLHLPVELFWRILRDACYTCRLPENSGEVLDAAFWPAWDAAGTNNSARVIPDLFLRFTEFDLIIEAKRWDDSMQDKHQWW
ncbi:MAG: hypothetical protein WC661_22035 [Opitutaceae bacterium]